MKVTDKDMNRMMRTVRAPAIPKEAGLFSPCVKDTHDTEDIMAGLPVDLKIVKAADIFKKGRVRRSADRWQVDLHLDAADILKLAGVDEPFGTFAITF
jgi:hypothetical protein